MFSRLRGTSLLNLLAVVIAAFVSLGAAAPVSVKVRPGVGTPMQIRGAHLQRATAGLQTGGEPDLATARAFLRSHRDLLLLQEPEKELALAGRLEDELGLRHLKFEQRFRGLPVWPSEVILHLDEEGSVYLLDGAYVPTPKLASVQPVVSSKEAVRRVRTIVPDGARAEVSRPELILYAPGTRDPRLAWRVETASALDQRWLVVLDAVNGAKLLAYNQAFHAAVPGFDRDLAGKARDFGVWREGGSYYLVDTSKPMYDPTSVPPLPASTRGAIFLFDLQNQDDPSKARLVTSRSARSWDPADAVSAAFGLSSSYDYFLEVHGRNSIDNAGGSLYAFVRFDRGLQNALWNGEAMLFGDARPYAGAYDVVAHELTHGVTQHTARLIYQDQPGALNEAFSDIFGQAVEARIEGSADWIVGDDLGSPIRSMKNPGDFEIAGRPYPSKMSERVEPGDPWLDQIPGRDSGGVHVNSGIVNRAFYLLAEGLPGAIGMEDAERIFYRALTLHLTGNAQFLDARLACIQSARELFGEGSPQELRTIEAFDEVEIFDDVPTCEPRPREIEAD